MKLGILKIKDYRILIYKNKNDGRVGILKWWSFNCIREALINDMDNITFDLLLKYEPTIKKEPINILSKCLIL